MKKRKELEKEIQRIEENKGEELGKVLKLQQQISEIEDEKCRGAIIRSEAKYVVEGERSTKFFFNLEKNRRQI